MLAERVIETVVSFVVSGLATRNVKVAEPRATDAAVLAEHVVLNVPCRGCIARSKTGAAVARISPHNIMDKRIDGRPARERLRAKRAVASVVRVAVGVLNDAGRERPSHRFVTHKHGVAVVVPQLCTVNFEAIDGHCLACAHIDARASIEIAQLVGLHVLTLRPVVRRLNGPDGQPVNSATAVPNPDAVGVTVPVQIDPVIAGCVAIVQILAADSQIRQRRRQSLDGQSSRYVVGYLAGEYAIGTAVDVAAYVVMLRHHGVSAVRVIRAPVVAIDDVKSSIIGCVGVMTLYHPQARHAPVVLPVAGEHAARAIEVAAIRAHRFAVWRPVVSRAHIDRTSEGVSTRATYGPLSRLQCGDNFSLIRRVQRPRAQKPAVLTQEIPRCSRALFPDLRAGNLLPRRAGAVNGRRTGRGERHRAIYADTRVERDAIWSGVGDDVARRAARDAHARVARSRASQRVSCRQ